MRAREPAGDRAGGGGLGRGAAGRARLLDQPADRAASAAVGADAVPDPQGLDADEFEAALTGALRTRRWTRRSRPPLPRNGRRSGEEGEEAEAEAAGRGEVPGGREDGWFRPHPLHPWLDPAVTGDPGHVPARHGVAVDGKERKGAKAGGRRSAPAGRRHRYARHRDRAGQGGQVRQGERDHPLQAAAGAPAAGAGRCHQRCDAGEQGNALFLREVKNAHYLWPVLGNQPN